MRFGKKKCGKLPSPKLNVEMARKKCETSGFENAIQFIGFPAE